MKQNRSPRKMASHALTLADHRKLTAEKGRPLTDRPIGTSTEPRRRAGAEASAVFRVEADHTDALERMVAERKSRTKLCGTVAGWKAHTERNEWPCQRCREARRRERNNPTTTEDTDQ